MYALYSQEQSDMYKSGKGDEWGRKVCYNIYVTEKGEERIVTEVSESSDRISDHTEDFSDSRHLGIVVEWKRTVY